MPSLTIWIDPPDGWEESVVSIADEGVTHRLTVSGKLAPFRTRVVPQDPGWDLIHVEIACAQKQHDPYIGISRHEGAYAGIVVDMPALTWTREQWAKGRRVEINLHGENVPGFTLGTAPDGDDVVWDQNVAKHVKLEQSVLRVSAYKDGTELQASEAPILQAPIHPDLKSNLAKIASRLDLLLGVALIFSIYYWTHR